MRAAYALGAAAGVMVGLAGGAAGCGADCCQVDSLPIPLGRAPRGDGVADGALVARAAEPGGTPFSMVVDTASPITILAGDAAPTISPRGS